MRPAASRGRALRALSVLGLLVAAVASGCGGDEETSGERPRERDRRPVESAPAAPAPETPEPQAPEPEREALSPAPEAPQPEAPPPPAEETVTPPSSDGGTPAPAPEPPPDGPENDVPPPRDSPAERFEAFCNENPAACS